MCDLDVIGNDTGGGRLGPSAPVRYWRYRDGRWQSADGAVIREAPVTIFLDGRELVTLLCTPLRLNHLVLGFLANEGLIEGPSDLAMMRVCDEEATVDVRLSRPMPPVVPRRILASGCGGAFTLSEQVGQIEPLSSSLMLAPDEVLGLMKALYGAATLFREHGGVHSSALADRAGLVAVAEDVGRHNTVDKIRGQCLLEGLPTADHILLTTGRLSSEIVTKAARMAVPLLVSRNSPTSRAVAMGDAMGITLVGYARSGGITVYTHAGRIAGGASE